ncbi:hypothetical protein Zmor_012473 [Zophobas morio]|uniref:THAP domain-containing protein 9 n=1 Tax=Zophobas morio TaxID=2755281 RepID=A0AA38IDQ3_9CUCU|nr:hypothetical protein Zmor_012473 [Zophobas morio]
MKTSNKTLLCNMVRDEMSVRQHVMWTGKRLVSYVNYGFNMEGNDSLLEARNALVFMLVALNSRWKIPVAYFFINGLSGEERANLVMGCFDMLQDTGVVISSITFDGAACNLAMANSLGASLTCDNLKPYFPRPVTNNPVYIILEICHMIKLIRNELGDTKILYDEEGIKILWEFLEKLVELVEFQLHAVTKIRKCHLNYHNEKMKVSLAVQMLSDSVLIYNLYWQNTFSILYLGSFLAKLGNFLDEFRGKVINEVGNTGLAAWSGSPINVLATMF